MCPARGQGTVAGMSLGSAGMKPSQVFCCRKESCLGFCLLADHAGPWGLQSHGIEGGDDSADRVLLSEVAIGYSEVWPKMRV